MELADESGYLPVMATAVRPVGDLLREWRQRRRLSQLDLALDADVSTRHLSFVETGRARPSREMVLHLAEHLSVPLREQNLLLVAAGYAPAFPERPLDDPDLAAAREAVDLVLTGHEPYPAAAIDRRWILLAANRAVAPFMAGTAPELLAPPVNLLRLSLHPDGLARRILNFDTWRTHIIERLRRQIERTADQVLVELMQEIAAYPVPPRLPRTSRHDSRNYAGIGVPLQLASERGPLNLFHTTTVFGTPVDITLDELALEAFYPADAATRDILRDWSSGETGD